MTGRVQRGKDEHRYWSPRLPADRAHDERLGQPLTRDSRPLATDWHRSRAGSALLREPAPAHARPDQQRRSLRQRGGPPGYQRGGG